jgi:hypothetical protein
MTAGDQGSSSSLERIAEAASGKSPPRDRDRVSRDRVPRDRVSAERARDGDYDIRIARDGTWYHEGTPITRLPLVKLFSTVLRRQDDGGYWLITPVERGTIVVEDAPFVAVEATVTGADRDRAITFRTNIDETFVAGPDHPIRVEVDAETGEPSPYVLVRDNLEALIARAVFYDLVELAEEVERDGGTALVLWSGGVPFDLGRLDGDA